jgi:hypothetical protein
MILQDFQNYLRATKVANIRELSLYLRAQPEAIRAMADFLIRKRCIRKMEPDACGKGCQGCTPALVEIYEWIQ